MNEEKRKKQEKKRNREKKIKHDFKTEPVICNNFVKP